MTDAELLQLWCMASDSSLPHTAHVLAFARAVEERVQEECAQLAEARADERASASTRLGPDGNPCWAASQVDAYAATELRALAAAIRAGGGEGRREEQG